MDAINDICVIDLSKYSGQEKVLVEYLDEKEKLRASRFKFDHLRQNYISSHACLRFLLAKRLNLDPKAISFGYGLFGKPFIQNHKLHFNMSHSADMAIFAFSKDGEIGVDIEYINHKLPLSDLPLSFFPEEIQQEILTLPFSMQQKAFYKHWVYMEAYLKAIGVGLDLSFYKASLRCFSDWNIQELLIEENYVGAVAYKNPFCLTNASLETPTPKIKAAKIIEVPPTRIGIL